MKLGRTLLCLLLLSLLGLSAAQAQARRKLIIDQDCRGPATTDLLSALALIQSPNSEVLSITARATATPCRGRPATTLAAASRA